MKWPWERTPAQPKEPAMLVLSGYWLFCRSCGERHVFQLDGLSRPVCPVCGWVWEPKRGA